jgi:hypothetical protein
MTIPGERASLKDAIECCPGLPDRIEFNGFAVNPAPPPKTKSYAEEPENTKDEEDTCSPPLERQTALATAHSNITDLISVFLCSRLESNDR